MNSEEFFNRFAPIINQYKIPLIIGFFGLAFIAYGLISSSMNNQKEDILIDASDQRLATDVEKYQLVVDIEGAVINPGVYRLKRDARIQDALIAAGGMSFEADRNKIAKSINLASKVVDGAKIYIPSRSEVSLRETDQAVAGDSTLNDVEGFININTASENELDSLQGVGPVTASKIINNRPYSTIEELVSKKVVSQSVFGKIKDKIAVY